MLDLNHPKTKYILAIAREDDAVLSIAKRMTLIDTQSKLLLLPRAHEATEKMRIVCVEGWAQDRGKLDAVNLLHRQITEFANVYSTNNYLESWQGKFCTVCASQITIIEKYHDVPYCSKCLDSICNGRSAVDREFGLWCI